MSSYPTSSSWPYADFPQTAQVIIKDIEFELDVIWPGWRKKARFDHLDYDTKARIKWLLKRHSLVTYRTGQSPSPRYWDVIIVRDGKDRGQCYAHPVIPNTDATDTTRQPTSVMPTTLTLTRENLGLEGVSKQLNIPVDILREQLKSCPSFLSDKETEE